MAGLLKKLEINGFKSFGQKTVFEFPGGITGIVGPNGSGKSNVIDAIRWLLGEREAKNLRGGKAEDLIFAGTSKRPRMSMAQASLYFDNRDKFFPAEFAEISVTRQVNRDGTNQYYLNKSEVRLKDLVDFFAKARLGTKGMIVVTQGNSDLFIRVTPTERREMIEEMLGLREYQLKKTEAEKRLKNTQINLDKVHALSEEILPHLRSLKRQTSRWERRDSIAQELHNLENRYFGSEIHDIETKTANFNQEIEARNATLKTLIHEKAQAEENLKNVEASQPEGRKEIELIKAETQKLLENRSLLQKEMGRLEARMEIEVRAETHTKVSADLISLVKKIRTTLNNFETLSADELKAAIRGVMDEIETALGEKQPVMEKKEISPELKAEFEKIGKELLDLEAAITELKGKEQALEKGQEQFYLAFKAAVAAVESAKDKIERWEAGTQSLVFEKERVQFRRQEWDRQVRQSGRTPEEFMNLKAEPVANHERDEMDRKIFRLRGELASIGEIDEALLKEARETETRYEFLNRESQDLEKAKEDLRSLIAELNEKIKKEFEGALEEINLEFTKFFSLMFDGGYAKLKVHKEKPKDTGLSEDDLPESAQEEVKDAVRQVDEEPAEEGIEIELKMVRKRVTSLGMLSGGERSLVGIAALFAMISVSPPPFLVLDEVDAPLDEKNARRFSEMLREFSKKTQFILVTHNRATMEAADVLYGVTLGEDEASKVVSLKLEK